MGNSFKAPGNSTSAAGIRPCSRNSTGNNIDASCSACTKINCQANPKLRIYTFEELKIATNNFNSKNFIGEGSFGGVYKAWADEETLNPATTGQGMAVAVKAWKPDSYLGPDEWQREVDILGRISHPNFIKLVGHCRGKDKLLLVYEFMPNGSLHNHLFNKGTEQPLSWEQRLKIAVGAARGLAFLHAPENNIIHRNVKPSNILLDSTFNPNLSGFMLARVGPAEADSHVTTRVLGTYGFAAPEYVATGHLSLKADVYAFGVVLLQLLSGKRAVDEVPSGGKRQLLTEYAAASFSNHTKFDRLMDPSLEKQYPVKAARRAGQLAGQCLSINPARRPSMCEVVEILEQIISDGSTVRR